MKLLTIKDLETLIVCSGKKRQQYPFKMKGYIFKMRGSSYLRISYQRFMKHLL
jgi:hypothetical protein